MGARSGGVMGVSDDNELRRQYIMAKYHLSYEDAGQYVMERLYNRMTHLEALAEMREQGKAV